MYSHCDLPPTKKYNKPRRWIVENLWKDSLAMEHIYMDVEHLWQRYQNAFCWTLYGEKVDNDFFLKHMKRILDADLNYPIILSEEEYILDGVHRLMKCKFLGKKQILCVKYQKDPPDIKK